MKKKHYRVPDNDFAMIEEMKRQFQKQGLNASDSDIISAALRALKEKRKVVIDLDDEPLRPPPPTTPPATKRMPRPKPKRDLDVISKNPTTEGRINFEKRRASARRFFIPRLRIR